MTVNQILQTALQHQHAGRFAEAEGLYRQALAIDPSQPDAWHLLGTLAQACGKLDLALGFMARAISLRPAAEYYFNYGNALLAAGRADQATTSLNKAIQLKPGFAEVYYTLGSALRELGKIGEACNALSQAVALKPNWAEAWNALGVMLKSKGDLDGASKAYRNAIRLKPNYEEVYSKLGNVLVEQTKWQEAATVFRKALQLKPQSLDALNALGTCLSSQGMLDEAIATFREAIAVKPDCANVHNNLGIALTKRGNAEEGIAAYRVAIELDPNMSDTYSNLGIALNAVGRLDDAIAAFRRSIELNPGSSDTYINMGIAIQDQGRFDEAIDVYRRAVELNPSSAQAHNNLSLVKDQGQIEDAVAELRCAAGLDPKASDIHSNLLFYMCFHPQITPRRIFEESKAWEKQHTAFPSRNIRRHDNDPSMHRRLKIGYVSPDLSTHAVGRFLIPVIDHHNRKQFEIHCFSNVARPDSTTDWFRKRADYWHDIRGKTDDAAAEMVRKEQIDILVDLALHTRGNRLLVFARKPAPVQATFLAYCSTSGMQLMDYLITDRYLLPAGEERFICEKPLRLPFTYWCFRPLPDTPGINPLPALARGKVTFGCMNSYGKVNGAVLSLWCQILKAVPDSRLVLHAAEGSHRERARDQLAREGVDPNRLDFNAYALFNEYFQRYHSIDIGLDPFPFAGGTTTCDTLWMGVPVVSLAGRTTVSRGGLSILTNAGLPELVARSPEEYVKIAVELAGDLPRLAELRATMRQRMKASPLMDEARYVADVEAAYRGMWSKWCEQQKLTEA